MKNKTKILLTVLLSLSFYSNAKTERGVYMNVSDYKANKLSYAIECTKIHLHDFFWNMTTIKLVNDGKKITLKKDDIYGYRDCNNDVYRFYKNMEYRIAETGYMYIYVRRENIDQNKNNKVVNVYYFSTKADGDILALNIDNLKKAYRNNEKFLDLLDKYFNAADVCGYDELHNTFKVNYLFSKTINN